MHEKNRDDATTGNSHRQAQTDTDFRCAMGVWGGFWGLVLRWRRWCARGCGSWPSVCARLANCF